LTGSSRATIAFIAFRPQGSRPRPRFSRNAPASLPLFSAEHLTSCQPKKKPPEGGLLSTQTGITQAGRKAPKIQVWIDRDSQRRRDNRQRA